jgi:hypothetical protein
MKCVQPCTHHSQHAPPVLADSAPQLWGLAARLYLTHIVFKAKSSTRSSGSGYSSQTALPPPCSGCCCVPCRVWLIPMRHHGRSSHQLSKHCACGQRLSCTANRTQTATIVIWYNGSLWRHWSALRDIDMDTRRAPAANPDTCRAQGRNEWTYILAPLTNNQHKDTRHTLHPPGRHPIL